MEEERGEKQREKEEQRSSNAERKRKRGKMERRRMKRRRMKRRRVKRRRRVRRRTRAYLLGRPAGPELFIESIEKKKSGKNNQSPKHRRYMSLFVNRKAERWPRAINGQ